MEADAQGRRWTLVAVCTTTFMLLLDITIVNVALPSSRLVFRGSTATAGSFWRPRAIVHSSSVASVYGLPVASVYSLM